MSVRMKAKQFRREQRSHVPQHPAKPSKRTFPNMERWFYSKEDRLKAKNDRKKKREQRYAEYVRGR